MANDVRFEVYPQRWREAGEGNPAELEVGEPTGEYGWRFRAANGQITAIGGEGFTRREDAERAVGDFLESLDAFDWKDGRVRPPILDVDD